MWGRVKQYIKEAARKLPEHSILVLLPGAELRGTTRF